MGDGKGGERAGKGGEERKDRAWFEGQGLGLGLGGWGPRSWAGLSCRRQVGVDPEVRGIGLLAPSVPGHPRQTPEITVRLAPSVSQRVREAEMGPEHPEGATRLGSDRPACSLFPEPCPAAQPGPCPCLAPPRALTAFHTFSCLTQLLHWRLGEWAEKAQPAGPRGVTNPDFLPSSSTGPHCRASAYHRSLPDATLGSPCELPQRPRDLLCPWVVRCPQGQGSLAPAATHLGFPQVPRTFCRSSRQSEGVLQGRGQQGSGPVSTQLFRVRVPGNTGLGPDCSSSCHCAWSPEEPRGQPHPVTHTGLLWGVPASPRDEHWSGLGAPRGRAPVSLFRLCLFSVHSLHKSYPREGCFPLPSALGSLFS